MLWLGGLALAMGAPEPEAVEEVVVYDHRALWDGTRFHVRSEQTVSTGVVLGAPETGTLRTPAWQLELVVACELEGRRRAACAVEDAAIRATTRKRWQHPTDRAEVETILAAVREQLIGSQLDIRFDTWGELRRADVDGAGTEDHVLDVVDLATRVLGGVARPRGAMEAGAVWTRPSDELLRLPATTEAIQSAQVNHFGGFLDGHYVVQTVGEASLIMELLPPLDRPHGAERPAYPTSLGQDANPGRPITAFGTLQMASVAAYDPDSGLLEERVYQVGGGTPRPFAHGGSVRLLGPDETPDLGATTQVAYPGVARLQLPPWESLSRLDLPGEEVTW